MKKIVNWKCNNKAVNTLLMIMIPPMAFYLVEGLTHAPIEMKTMIIIANLMIYYLVYGFLSFLIGRFWVGYTLGTIFLGLCGMINYAVIEFRSSPIQPWDLFSIRTAASVAKNYSLTFTEHLKVTIALFLLLVFLSTRIGITALKWKKQFAGLIILSFFLYGYIHYIGTDEVVEWVGLDTTLYNPNTMYQRNGLVTGFLGNMKYLLVEKPEGYSGTKVKNLSEQYPVAEHISISEQNPNVIVIMNESFADLSVYGEIVANKDPLEYIHSLEKNTIKGQCYVSVKGGNTPNSEYEFLTGNTMAFLPIGSIPYQQYIKGEIPSLASYLKEQGYRSIAIHPFRSTGWSRDVVYPLLGFDEMIFMDQFEEAPTMRHFVTDEGAFQKIVDLYEEKEIEQRLFVFEVTMQNHGGYNKKADDFKAKIKLSDFPEKTKDVKAAQNYLTLMQYSDNAFKNLVSYFEKEEEPTIILMFGDHQPSDNVTDLISSVYDLDSQEKERLSYIVPYIIWSNFDMELSGPEETSLNYLSGLLMEKAGLPLTGYQTYLKNLSEKYPVISAKIMIDSEGNVQEPDPDAINEYGILAYNQLSGGKDRLKDFYNAVSQ